MYKKKKRDDNDSWSDCLNWNFLKVKYSSKCTDSNGRSATFPHKLSLKLQQEKVGVCLIKSLNANLIEQRLIK